MNESDHDFVRVNTSSGDSIVQAFSELFACVKAEQAKRDALTQGHDAFEKFKAKIGHWAEATPQVHAVTIGFFATPTGPFPFGMRISVVSQDDAYPWALVASSAQLESQIADDVMGEVTLDVTVIPRTAFDDSSKELYPSTVFLREAPREGPEPL
ncbi:MAG: hypothetical protein KDA05_01250 [Phycisphaerales bacterium]|nr:hypothetical protein [Phycisphaerales bacterium]